MRTFMICLVGSDGVFLLLFGLSSLLFVPGSAGEPYLSQDAGCMVYCRPYSE
jgi:hypothetical protein